MKEVMHSLNEFFETNVKPLFRIISVSEEDHGWFAAVEVIEEDEYIQKYGRDQFFGMYEATMNSKQQITSYQKINTRPRSVPFEKKER